MTFHLMCVHIILSSVWVAEWQPFGKKLLTRLTICFFLYFDYLSFQLFPVLVLRAGFGSWLLQFLVLAYFLLLPSDPTST